MMYYIIYTFKLSEKWSTDKGPGERQHSGKSRGTSAGELEAYHFSLLEKKRSELALGLHISLALSRIKFSESATCPHMMMSSFHVMILDLDIQEQLLCS